MIDLIDDVVMGREELIEGKESCWLDLKFFGYLNIITLS